MKSVDSVDMGRSEGCDLSAKILVYGKTRVGIGISSDGVGDGGVFWLRR